MTPPDSDGPRVYRPGDPEYFHAPDSDAREVCNPMGARRVIRALRLQAEKDASQEVTLPLSLAQRILAALEDRAGRDLEIRALVSELRAVIGK